MMRTFGLLLVAGLAVLALVPSTSAMTFVPPPPPNPQCPVTPPPTEGGVVGAAKQIAHDETYAACQSAGNGIVIAQAGYGLAMGEVGIVVGIVGPAVDQTQDNACQFLYGDPNANEPGCHDIVVDLSMSASASLPLPVGF
jgi:hypothetical protein